MSLAEELLADLEDYDDDDLAAANAGAEGGADAGASAHDGLGAALDAAATVSATTTNAPTGGGGGIDEIREEDEEENGAAPKKSEAQGLYERVNDVARLRNSDHFKSIMTKLMDEMDQDHVMETENAADPTVTTSEHDAEYQLIVQANNLAVEIDNELNVIHKFIRDKYAKRFPELESLVPMPLEYIACVKELGNDILEKAKNSEHLQQTLLPATVIVVSVTASTTQGEILTPEELEIVEEACDMAEEINDAKIRIFHFVESRMTRVAPNLCRVAGATTAAKLMGVAGGLKQLSKMPACNVLVLGAQKNTLSGFSSTAIMPHTGFVYYTQSVQSLPPDLRKKAARQVAAKCTLAARVDACHESKQGQIGATLAEQVSRKFDKWQEPPPFKQVKALPKPLDQASKKRGGRRIRKMKERLGLTDMRSKAYRMTFGDIQEDVFQDHLGVTLGQMKHGGNTPGGRIRAAQVDQKSRARMSQKLQRNLQRQNAAAGGLGTAVGGASTSAGGSTTVASKRQSSSIMTAGTVSTVTFTPVQGLEISNPAALADKKSAIDAANAKYFGASSGFLKIRSGNGNNSSMNKGIMSSLKAER